MPVLFGPVELPELAAEPPDELPLEAPERSGLRPQRNLLNRINLIWAVQSYLQKQFCSRLTQIKIINAPSRPTEGRIAIVTNAGRDAMDADGAFDEWC